MWCLDARSGSRLPLQVEANAPAKFTGMPFHLRDDAAFARVRSGPVAKTGVEALHILGLSSDGALERMGNAPLKDHVGRLADRVLIALGFEEIVKVGPKQGRLPHETLKYSELTDHNADIVPARNGCANGSRTEGLLQGAHSKDGFCTFLRAQRARMRSRQSQHCRSSQAKRFERH